MQGTIVIGLCILVVSLALGYMVIVLKQSEKKISATDPTSKLGEREKPLDVNASESKQDV